MLLFVYSKWVLFVFQYGLSIQLILKLCLIAENLTKRLHFCLAVLMKVRFLIFKIHFLLIICLFDVNVISNTLFG